MHILAHLFRLPHSPLSLSLSTDLIVCENSKHKCEGAVVGSCECKFLCAAHKLTHMSRMGSLHEFTESVSAAMSMKTARAKGRASVRKHLHMKSSDTKYFENHTFVPIFRSEFGSAMFLPLQKIRCVKTLPGFITKSTD